MSVGEFWETLVLRDILSYLIPGSVALAALAVLAIGCGLREWGIFVSACLPPDRWLTLAVMLALSYLLGHVLTWISVRAFDKGRWNIMYAAYEYMNWPDAQDTVEAALEMIGEEKRRTIQREGLQPHTVGYLRRICDHYVLDAAPDMHRAYIGRCWVFYGFSRHSGLALILLGLCILALLCPAGRAYVAETLKATPHQLVAWYILGSSAILVAGGGLLLARALAFRGYIAQYTFEVFYVLRLREKWSVRSSAGGWRLSRFQAGGRPEQGRSWQEARGVGDEDP